MNVVGVMPLTSPMKHAGAFLTVFDDASLTSSEEGQGPLPGESLAMVLGPSFFIKRPIGTEDMNNMIVCGWYTPDYFKWLAPLTRDLDRRNLEYDFVEAEKLSGGWERNCREKPKQIKEALLRNPHKTILFLDVDCRIIGTCQEILTLGNIPGDLGVYIRPIFNRQGRAKLRPRSGTLVLKPSDKAMALVEAWIAAAANARPGQVDEDSLIVALGHVPYLSVTVLPVELCAVFDEVEQPIILHNCGSLVDGLRSSKTQRFFRRLASPFANLR